MGSEVDEYGADGPDVELFTADQFSLAGEQIRPGANGCPLQDAATDKDGRPCTDGRAANGLFGDRVTASAERSCKPECSDDPKCAHARDLL